MKQLIQDLMHGHLKIIETPSPKVRENFVLIKTELSLISLGTEKMLLDFGKAGILSKARKHPDKVRQVIDKVKTDGFVSTFSSVRRKLNEPLPLGYSNVGEVIDVGKGVDNVSIGDRVLSNGPHAEIVNVPSNLVSLIPDGVSSEDAVFGVIGAIALQSIRLTKPSIGETICVMGLGLVGNVLVQILLANGCNVVVVEKDRFRLSLIKNKNVKKINLLSTVNIEKEISEISAGLGVDAVIIATATKSSQPCVDAIKITRSKGRIVVVGTAGMNIDRDLLFKKELSVQVSRSYGPGRYDPNYENKNQDYPIEYIRWSAGRNFDAFLYLLKNKLISLSDLTTEKHSFNNVIEVYENLNRKNQILGTILDYKSVSQVKKHKYNKIYVKNNISINKSNARPIKNIGFVGSGNYAQAFLLPSLKSLKANLKILVSRNPISSSYLSSKFKIQNVSCDLDEILKNDEIDTVFIATNHDSHSQIVIECLKRNKNIYVEKPLCIDNSQLTSIIKAYKLSKARLVVGFNRRFAPYYQICKSVLSSSESPSVINIMINAGIVAKDHWVNDSKVGGGRVIGEMCHFLDLLVYLTGSNIIKQNTNSLKHADGKNIFVTLKLGNGSIGNIHYITNGDRSFPKERVEIFQAGKIIKINNFKSIQFYGFKNKRNKFSFVQNKGTKNMIDAFINNNESEQFATMEEIINVSKVSFDIDKIN